MSGEWHPRQELESLGVGKDRVIKRSTRVADVIKNELSLLLVQRVRDPRLRDVSISRVELSDDLRYAKVYFTSLRGKQEAASAKKGLLKARGFIRSHLAKKINLRFTPDLNFWYDETVEKIEQMEKLLAELAKERDERDQNS